jgi:hypothetical protein
MIRHPALHDPIRRGVALVVTISFHLFVLILMAWPAIQGRGIAPVERSHRRAIQIRFFRPSRPPSAPMASSTLRVITPALHVRTTLSTQPLPLLAVQYATPAAPRPTERHSPGSPATSSTPVTGNSDGGFRERLRDAQHSYAVHGIPGSDRPFVHGIHLIDPRKQGIGGAVRKVQRLFGVIDSHCVDVDVWRNLTPRELIARHVSPDEVDRTDEKYDCNRPLGLSF